ncbi:hypothetical protein F5I97DRAFT_32471 [Phlebopus sp. FC_14]|nr:hypothetical protein F5I97DRAFT_32471 [Phlebopus sp. FC_14]
MASKQRRGPKYFPKPPVSAEFLLKDLETSVATFTTDSAASADDIKICNVKAVASYSWIDTPTPTILVPGSPRVWANKHIKRVPKDSGVQYVDRNSREMGDHSSHLPLFAAIDCLHENFGYNEHDFITDRNCLRKLLRYIRCSYNDDDFRINIDMLQKTCLFSRCEENTTENLTAFRGFGHEYERAATKAPHGCERTSGHHRILSYDFGGLKVLLRCTVDACTESEIDDDDLFLASFNALSIRSRGSAISQSYDLAPSPMSGLTVKITSPRSLIPQSDIIEIKTRSVRKDLDWDEIYPQLYLSQTGYLYVARHDYGAFQPAEKIKLNGPDMKPYIEHAEETICKLKALLDAILKAVRKEGSGVPLSLVSLGGQLALYKRKEGTGKPLGEKITSKFELVPPEHSTQVTPNDAVER